MPGAIFTPSYQQRTSEKRISNTKVYFVGCLLVYVVLPGDTFWMSFDDVEPAFSTGSPHCPFSVERFKWIQRHEQLYSLSSGVRVASGAADGLNEG